MQKDGHCKVERSRDGFTNVFVNDENVVILSRAGSSVTALINKIEMKQQFSNKFQVGDKVKATRRCKVSGIVCGSHGTILAWNCEKQKYLVRFNGDYCAFSPETYLKRCATGKPAVRKPPTKQCLDKIKSNKDLVSASITSAVDAFLVEAKHAARTKKSKKRVTFMQTNNSLKDPQGAQASDKTRSDEGKCKRNIEKIQKQRQKKNKIKKQEEKVKKKPQKIQKEVSKWLEKFKLSQFSGSLMSEGFISIVDIVDMDDEDIAACQILKRGDIKRFKRAIKQWKSENGLKLNSPTRVIVEKNVAASPGSFPIAPTSKAPPAFAPCPPPLPLPPPIKSAMKKPSKYSTIERQEMFGTASRVTFSKTDTPEFSLDGTDGNFVEMFSKKVVKPPFDADECEKLAKENAELVKKLSSSSTEVSSKDIARLKELHQKIGEMKAAKDETRSMIAGETSLLNSRLLGIKEIESKIAESEKVDLCFLLDATSSMGPHINKVKLQINKIVQELKVTNPSMVQRLAIVAYRDLGDSPRFNVMDFSESIESFQLFLDEVKAKGGGDTCEDVQGGIENCLDLSWKFPTKMIFHIADAPSHGANYSGGCNDDHPDAASELPLLLKRMDKILQIHYYFGKISSNTETMLSQFNLDVGRENFVTIVPLDIGIVKAVTKTVRKSMFLTYRSMTKREVATSYEISPASPLRGPKRFSIDRSIPNWSELALQEVKMFTNKPIRSVNDLKEPGWWKFGYWKPTWTGEIGTATAAKDRSQVQIQVASEPFDKGQCRLARHGQLRTPGRNGKTGVWKPYVFKEFIESDKRANSLLNYCKQMEVSTVAAFLAKLYNKNKDPRLSEVHFLSSHTVEAVNYSSGDSSKKCYTIEKPLYPPEEPLDFVKYNNNTGFWDEDAFDETLLRFTEFTYKITDNFLLVADLQGVKKTDGSYLLTDPVILCTDVTKYGTTNLGPCFIKKVLENGQRMMSFMLEE
jgi:hypothetical protein